MRDRLPANPYRYGLFALAFAQLGVTLQALIAPRSFYDSFPFGRGWVEAYPAYNEHLIYDYGAYTLGALIALVLAGIWLDRRVVQLAIDQLARGSQHPFRLPPGHDRQVRDRRRDRQPPRPVRVHRPAGRPTREEHP